MKTSLHIKFLLVLFSLFIISCEKHQAAYEHGTPVDGVIVKKYETGSNNPASKGPRKSFYFDVQVPTDKSVHRVSADRVTWNASKVGYILKGYYHEGTFVPAFAQQ